MKSLGVGEVVDSDPSHQLSAVISTIPLANTLQTFAMVSPQNVRTAIGAAIDNVTGGQSFQPEIQLASDAIGIAKSGGRITWTQAYGAAALATSMIPGVGVAVGGVIAAVGFAVGLVTNAIGLDSDFFGSKPTPPSTPVNISMDNWAYRTAPNPQTFVARKGPTDSHGNPTPGWIQIIDPNELKPGNDWALVLGESDATNYVSQGGTATLVGCPDGRQPWESVGPCVYSYALPVTTSFAYVDKSRAMFWVFGAVMNEIWRINQAPLDAEAQFRLFFYNMLLHNWEARINSAPNMNDRLVLLQAATAWNASHSKSALFEYQPLDQAPPLNFIGDADCLGTTNCGFCQYEFAFNGYQCQMHRDAGKYKPNCPSRPSDPSGWSYTDITWTWNTPFLQFIMSAAYDQWPFPLMPGRSASAPPSAMDPIQIHAGPKIDVTPEKLASRRNEMKLLPSFLQLQDQADEAAALEKKAAEAWSASAKWAFGLGSVATAATGALWWYAHRHHLPMRTAAQQIARQVKQKVVSKRFRGRR